MGSFAKLLAFLVVSTSITSPMALPQQSVAPSFSQPASAPPPSSSSSVAKASSTTLPIPSPSATLQSGEYYPDGKSYSADPLISTDPGVDTATGGNDGNSVAFMGLSVPALAGIIAGVLVMAIAVFLVTVVYYYRRKRQWELNMRECIATQAASSKIGKGSSVESLTDERRECAAVNQSKPASKTDQTPGTPKMHVKSVFENETIEENNR